MAEYQKSLCRVRPLHLAAGQPATLYLDEQVLSALDAGRMNESRWLSPGSYRVRVAGPGLRDYNVSIDLRPGEARELTGDVVHEGSESSLLADNQAKAPKQEPLPFYRKPWFWGVVGGGGPSALALSPPGGRRLRSHRSRIGPRPDRSVSQVKGPCADPSPAAPTPPLPFDVCCSSRCRPSWPWLRARPRPCVDFAGLPGHHRARRSRQYSAHSDRHPRRPDAVHAADADRHRGSAGLNATPCALASLKTAIAASSSFR